ncbi:MAG: MATE family efflux transporter [Bifidobacteriaceae bacterium]|jgi:putative MATE family efflux protein|nr:MATE family efflux transporter [Bifidobacteriaceae bacterium]
MTSARRRVLRLAAPALGALAAEPLFVMVDSAIVGRLGTAPLAGLALAGAVLETCVYLCVFLAYATTAGVARAFGAGDLPDAARRGVDALWLALGLGLPVAAILVAFGRPVLGWFGPDAAVLAAASEYLRWSAPGLPAMLVVLAAVGVLRGLQNTRLTLYVALAGGVANATISFTLCYPAGMGIRGAALGTVISQLGMAAWAGGSVVALARRTGTALGPRARGLGAAGRAGAPLFVRTCCLRAAGLATLWVATTLGAVELAAHQIVSNVWSFSALCTDALAIAAQALVGASLGGRDAIRADRAAKAGPPPDLAEVKRAVVSLSVGSGAALGAVFAASSWVLPWAFTADPAVRSAAGLAVAAVAVCMPLAAWAFALDGILMGAAESGGFLAKGMAASVICYLPWAGAVAAWADGPFGLTLVWLGYAGWFMAVRALVYRRRAAAI